MTPRELREMSERFAADNLSSLAVELIEWQDTAILRDGLVREMARDVAGWAGPDYALKVTESLICRAALDAAAK